MNELGGKNADYAMPIIAMNAHMRTIISNKVEVLF